MPAFSAAAALGTAGIYGGIYGGTLIAQSLYNLIAPNIDSTVANVTDVISSTQPIIPIVVSKPDSAPNIAISAINLVSKAGNTKNCTTLLLGNTSVRTCASVVKVASDAAGDFIADTTQAITDATPVAVETYADWLLNNPMTTGFGVIGCMAAIGLITYACTRSNVQDNLKPVAPEPVTKTPSNTTQLKLIEQLKRFEKSLIKLHEYEVSPSTKLALEKHVIAIDAFRVELSSNKRIDKSHFITGQDLLKAALETMDKASFETRGGAEKEKGSMFTGYAYLMACARKAFNLFTQLFVKMGLVSHQDAANPVAKALLGQSFFFQVSPTQKENVTIKAQQEILTQVTDEVEQLKTATIG